MVPPAFCQETDHNIKVCVTDLSLDATRYPHVHQHRAETASSLSSSINGIDSSSSGID